MAVAPFINAFIGFAVMIVYLLLLQRSLAKEVSRSQGKMVFFLLSLIGTIFFFCLLAFPVIWIISNLHTGDVVSVLLLLLIVAPSPVLSVLFWRRVLRDRKKQR